MLALDACLLPGIAFRHRARPGGHCTPASSLLSQVIDQDKRLAQVELEAIRRIYDRERGKAGDDEIGTGIRNDRWITHFSLGTSFSLL